MNSRVTIIFLTGLTIAGSTTAARASDDPALTVCEASIKMNLKSPKSYERVDSALLGDWVAVTYDAVNEFNAPLRHSDSCRFVINKDGKVVIEPAEFVELAHQLRDMTERLKAATGKPEAATLLKEGQALQLRIMTKMLGYMKLNARLKKMDGYPISLDATAIKPTRTESDTVKDMEK